MHVTRIKHGMLLGLINTTTKTCVHKSVQTPGSFVRGNVLKLMCGHLVSQR